MDDIAFYIAKDNRAAANRWLDNIYQRFQLLSDMPGIGVEPSDVRQGLRMFPVGNYLILYQIVEEDVEIVRVIHGARKWQELL